MRIAIHSHSFAPTYGGLERFGQDLASWLADRGHEVTVVTGTPAPPEHDTGLPYRVVRSESPRDALPVLRNADVIHVSGLSLRGIGMGRLARRPLVVTHHGYQAVCPTGQLLPEFGTCEVNGHHPGPCAGCPWRGWRGMASVRGHRLGARLAWANVGVSRFVIDRIGVPRATVIHNGLSTAALEHRPAEVENRLVGFAGRIVSEKGLDLLIRALPSVPGAQLEIAGDGPLLGEMQRLVEAVGVRDRARFLGRLPPEGVRELYRRSAIVCVPSRLHEPFGYALSEAMALGRPIVATPMGAFPELLQHGRGVLAHSTSAHGLADALAWLMGRPEDRTRMGEAARQFAERHLTLEAVGRQYETVYEGVVARTIDKG